MVAKKPDKGISKIERQKLNLLKQVTPKELKQLLNYSAVQNTKNIDKVIGESGHLIFGLLSDTHYGAKACAIDEIGEFMDIAKDKGAQCFMHCGDLVDGVDVYPGQQFEQSHHGFDEQMQLVLDKFPQTGLDTYIVQGNHDESFLKKTGSDIGKAINLVRKDLINLGFYDARIKLNGVDVNLHHGGGSTSYARSYKIQKLAENINPKDQPHIFASGHRHAALQMFYRKIHLFLPGAFAKENLLSKRFNLDNTIGGWIINVELDKNGGHKMRTEFIKL